MAIPSAQDLRRLAIRELGLLANVQSYDRASVAELAGDLAAAELAGDLAAAELAGRPAAIAIAIHAPRSVLCLISFALPK